MTTASSKQIVVGRVGSVHGVQGWLKIFSETHPRENILHYLPWQLRMPDGRYQAVEITGSRCQGNTIIVQFDHITDREIARRYTGADITIQQTQLPNLPEHEYYWADLIGLQVVTNTGLHLGTVSSLLETGSNDVLVVQGEEKRLIPYLPNVVLQVDIPNGQIIVDWPVDF